MRNAFEHRHAGEVERADALKAGDVDADFVGVRAAAVMRVDAADRTEVMLGGPGVELIQAQNLGAVRHGEVLQQRADDDSAAHPAERAIAAPWLVEAFR